MGFNLYAYFVDIKIPFVAVNDHNIFIEYVQNDLQPVPAAAQAQQEVAVQPAAQQEVALQPAAAQAQQKVAVQPAAPQAQQEIAVQPTTAATVPPTAAAQAHLQTAAATALALACHIIPGSQGPTFFPTQEAGPPVCRNHCDPGMYVKCITYNTYSYL